MHARSVDVILHALLEVHRVLIIPEWIHLRDHVEHVKAKSVHTFLEPEAERIRQFSPDRRVLPVEVRLLRRKEVQIVFIRTFYTLPGRAGKR